MTRGLVLGWSVCLLVSAGCGGDAPDQPNLVLLTVDRLATDRLPCFEGERDPGDALCALAEGGTLFAWAATGGRGEAASAATALTGLDSSEHGVVDDGRSFLLDAHTTLAEKLQRSGYATAAFIASPRVNRSRRLDQGFGLYDDRFASASRSSESPHTELAASVRDWIERAPSPWFVWIHAERDAGRVELDRLVSRLSESLEAGPGGPGVLFAALRGEPLTPATNTTPPPPEIDWRTHRIPLIWRPPPSQAGASPAVSRRLASLLDIMPTLQAAAQIPPPRAQNHSISHPAPDQRGRDLSRLALTIPSSDEPNNHEYFVLVFGGDDEVGLATETHLYARKRSPLDGTGRPVPTSSLDARSARFSTLPKADPLHVGTVRTARLEPGPWRSDILSAESPVPRLEFHLARRLDRPSENAPQ